MNYDKLLCGIFFKDDWHLNRNYVMRYNRAYKSNTRFQNVIKYIRTRYEDSTQLKEVLYRMKYHIDKKPVCKTCGKPVKFVGKSGIIYRQYCCNTCAGKNNETIIKKKQTQLQNWGTENCYDSDKYKQKIKQKYGVEYIVQRDDIKKKRKNTIIKKYGSIDNFNKINVDKIRKTFINKTGYDWPSKVPEIRNKYVEKSLLKFGTPNPMQCPEIREKVNKTLRQNNTFNSSQQEIVCEQLLKQIFDDDIITQYSDHRYPFNCDFYVKSLDLFIEYNGTWTHGKHPFNKHDKNDLYVLEQWKTKSTESKYYQNAIYVWTDLDIRKRECVHENKLNFIEFWSLSDVESFINLWISDLSIQRDDEMMSNEFSYFMNTESTCSNKVLKNNIIKYFQQDNLFQRERELWRNYDIKLKLILNRVHYLNKTINQLTLNDILSGFKKSGIYYGYSMFNPSLIKWFHERYDVTICYDPCGGWGHRILGSLNIKKYIYNDLSESTVECCKKMIEYFNINNVDIYNHDANNFIPDDDFDSMFTCVPYFNLEHYECGDFRTKIEYDNFINNIFNVFNNKTSCKIFGLVIREDLLPEKYKYDEKFDICVQTSKHFIKHKKYKEYLYVFKKR